MDTTVVSGDTALTPSLVRVSLMSSPVTGSADLTSTDPASRRGTMRKGSRVHQAVISAPSVARRWGMPERARPQKPMTSPRSSRYTPGHVASAPRSSPRTLPARRREREAKSGMTQGAVRIGKLDDAAALGGRLEQVEGGLNHSTPGQSVSRRAERPSHRMSGDHGAGMPHLLRHVGAGAHRNDRLPSSTPWWRRVSGPRSAPGSGPAR